MKILKIEFENINNLKGKHTIDFTCKPLKNADIFAITGVTGSGKSTLLDVITLALFNKTPRFSKISKGALTKEGSIITRNQKKSSAMIQYAIAGEIYTSIWSIKYNRNGNLNDYHMEIHYQNTILDLYRGEVPAKNEEIIGLNYEQFTKAIILSQGEFAKFLKANNDERSALLEKITGTSIYRELGIKTHEIYKEKKRVLDQIKSALESITPLSEEEVSKINKQQEEIDKNINEYKKSLQKNLVSIKQKENFLEVEESLKRLQQQQQEYAKKRIHFSEEQKLLVLHYKILPFRKELTDFSSKRTEISKIEECLRANKQKLAEQKRQKQQVITELQQIVRKEITEQNFLEEKNAFEKQVNQLVSDITHVQQNGLQQKQEIEELLKSGYLLELDFDINTTEETVTNELIKIDSLLQEHNYFLPSDFLKLEKGKTEIENRIHDYKELVKYQEDFIQVSQLIKNGEQEILKYQELLKEIPEKRLPFQKEQKLLELTIQELEISIKIASLSEHRNELKEGKECPLCGSVHHPFTKSIFQKEESLSFQLQKTKQELEKVTNRLFAITTQESLLKTKIEAQTNQNKKNEQQLLNLSNRTKEHLYNKDLFTKEPDKDWKKVLEQSQQQKTVISLIYKAFQKKEPLQQLQKKINKRSCLIKKYYNLKKQKDGLFAGGNISERMNDLENKFNVVCSSVLLCQNTIKNEEKSLGNIQLQLQNLSKNIDLVMQSTGIQDMTALQKAILTDQTVQKIERQKLQLQEEETQNRTLLTKAKKQLDRLHTDEIQGIDLIFLQNQKEAIESKKDNSIALLSALQEKIRQNNDLLGKQNKLKRDFKKAEAEFIKWDNLKRLIGDSSGKLFSTFAQGLTMQHLISYTNKRLQQLSGRYLIYIQSETQDLMIIDSLQANTERSVKTLSGGETFLVSLALALSLSDMASKNVKLESLFIDEGFGTLDEDTLENALSLLEKLQVESNKKVGVISHVKELKERITVQIQLQKDGFGYSTISVVPKIENR